MAGAGGSPGPPGLEGFLVEGTGAVGAQTGWLKVDGAVRWLSAGAGKVDLYEVPEGAGRGRPAAGDLKLVYSFEADWVKRVVVERSREKPAFVVSAFLLTLPLAASPSPPSSRPQPPPRSVGRWFVGEEPLTLRAFCPGGGGGGGGDLACSGTVVDSHEAEPLSSGARAHVQVLRKHEAGRSPDPGRAASSV